MPTTITRQTGAILRVIDDNLNSWEDLAGQDINIPVAYQYAVGDGPDEWYIGHWSYRGQAAMCRRTTDGAIVRARIGDGSINNYALFYQVITDPNDPAQWENWTYLYAGPNYAVAIQPDKNASSGYRIYHSKYDGLYVDNVLKITQGNIVKIKPAIGTSNDIVGLPGLVYYGVVGQDIDGERRIDWYYTPDANAGTPVTYADCANYRTYRQDVLQVLYESGDGRVDFGRFRAMAHDGGARDKMISDTMTGEFGQFFTATESRYNLWQNVFFLSGPSGQAGYKTFTNMTGLWLTDPSFTKPVFYLFHNEQQVDASGNVLSNLKSPLVWSRAVQNPFYLTQPTPTGFSIWGLAGAAVSGDYMYVAGNGRVLRRPLTSTTLDLSDYVLEGSYDLPRDNEPAAGTITLANPKNAVGQLLGLTDPSSTGLTERRAQFGLGMKSQTDTYYTFKSDAAWWITALRNNKDEDGKKQIVLELGDFWHKLSNPYLDTHRLPGRLAWVDWQPEAINQLYNYSVSGASEMTRYSPAGADPDTVPRLRAVPDGSNPYGEAVALFSGWRGENGYLKCTLWEWGGLVFRYVDQDNYYKVEVSSTGVRLIKRVGGSQTTLAELVYPFTQPNGEPLEIYFRWGSIQAWWNHGLMFDVSLSSPDMFVGFAGAISNTRVEISNLIVNEWHQWMTLRSLVRTILAHADEHQVVLDTDEETASVEQIDLLWGPQSDLNTPEKALRSLLTASQLNIVWREE